MTFLAAALAVILFLMGFWFFGVVPAAVAVVADSRSALEVLRDPSLDDEQKEAGMQKASISLFRGFFSILIRSAAALGISVIPVFAFDRLGLAGMDDTIDALASWQAIVTTTVVMTLAFVLGRRRKSG